MTPEQEALVQQVLDDAEMTERLLSQPRFVGLWKLHAWAFADHLDLQTHIADKSKRTASGWPVQFEADTAGYIKARVAEMTPRKDEPASDPPPITDQHVERFRALINGGNQP